MCRGGVGLNAAARLRLYLSICLSLSLCPARFLSLSAARLCASCMVTLSEESPLLSCPLWCPQEMQHSAGSSSKGGGNWHWSCSSWTHTHTHTFSLSHTPLYCLSHSLHQTEVDESQFRHVTKCVVGPDAFIRRWRKISGAR